MLRIFIFALLLAYAFGPAKPFAASGNPAAGATPEKLNVFLTAKRHSNLEPCGCRARQQGGLQFEASIYDRMTTAPAMRLDAGDWANVNVGESPFDAMKTRYVLRALALMNFDAVNVSLNDAQLSDEYFRFMREKQPKELPPLISANIYRRDRPGQLAFAPYRILNKTLVSGQQITIGITGVTELPAAFQLTEDLTQKLQALKTAAPGDQPRGAEMAKETAAGASGHTLQPAEVALDPVLSELRPQVELLVVLYSGDLAAARRLAQRFPQIDLLLINGGLNDHLSGQAGYELEGGVLLMLAPNHLGREIAMLSLQQESVASWKPAAGAQVQGLAVNQDFPARADMLALIEAFKKETQTIQVKLPGPEVKSLYAGAHQCQFCHKEAYQSWRATRHSRAMQTLVDRNQQFNPECVKCHTTGYQQSNGFYAAGHGPSQPMQGVQCEVCHGPAKEHAEMQLTILSGGERWMRPEDFEEYKKQAQSSQPKRRTGEQTCLGCHTPENDGQFAFGKKLKLVIHKHP